MTGVPRGHRLDHGQAERFSEADRVEQRVGGAEDLGSL